MRFVGLLLLAFLSACLPAVPAGTPQATPGEDVTPSLMPTLDAVAELERVMELRDGWGLRADEAWIRRVENASDSVMSDLGVPVTPQEAAELEEMVAQEPVTRLIMYGARERSQFGGLWVNEPGVGTVMLFTGDLDRHRRAITALAPGLPFEVRPGRFTEAELRKLQDELAEQIRRGEIGDPAMELLSLGLDTKNNALDLQVKSNDPSLKERLEAPFGGRVVATVHPLPGPWANVESGDGWRLLAAGVSRGLVQPYFVAAATDEEEWLKLWRSIDPVQPVPDFEAAEEIAALFSHGIGSSCPELRLDDTVIDRQAGVVYSATSDPLQPRMCTGDLVGASYFVVALQREALPESPFTLRLQQQLICADRSCGHTEEVEVDLRP